ncbi:MAG: hypothetical protein AMJ75_03300 [Phycisphaerae bacterium SM1_79]|nr:MAG: hypothetical protein AMJ75_03300 [Phycisphaerae bacterium SM1_79]
MDELKKPSMRIAILITLVALLDLFASFMMTASNTKSGLLITFVLCEIILTACAIAAWVNYSKAYINFAIEEKWRGYNKETTD